MGREVRKVPPWFTHPRDERGALIPLSPREYYEQSVHAEDQEDRYEEHDCMPPFTEQEATLFVMYENTTEGTPISPGFETVEELAHWLADNGASAFGNRTATYEQWLATCKRGWACSVVMSSAGLQSGVAGLAED